MTDDLICGVDEVGRGPLAGPVVAAAVILHPDRPIEGLADSKRLSPSCRERLAEHIKNNALCWSLGRAEPGEIDEINILQASLRAMERAVASLWVAPTLILVDGNRLPRFDCTARAVVGGDASVAQISAASIVAKVTRDAEMVAMEQKYPGYGFASHKGYPTKTHRESIERLGITPIHRRSFGPIKKVL